MARISASISDDLKDMLYQAALDRNIAISHIVTEALEAHFAPDPTGLKLGRSGLRAQTTGDIGDIGPKLDALALEIRELKEHLASRRPARTNRYF